jgi:lipopolysaccharide biosynthesis glycosyltransferase
MQDQIFVTYLGTDNFFPGVLVVKESLFCYHPKADLLILVSPDVSSDIIDILSINEWNFQIIEGIPNPNKSASLERNFICTYNKLQIFGLIEFKKIIYIDADMLICNNISELFNAPHFSAVTAGSLLPENRWWIKLNSGLLVIEPSLNLYQQILDSIDILPSKDGSDQGFLHAFYPEWPQSDKLHLHHRYNIPAIYLPEYCDNHYFIFDYRHKKLGTNTSIIHFINWLKPWNINMRLFKRRTTDKTEQALFLWWDTYEKAISKLNVSA